MSAIAETEHARSEQLDNPESIYRACADMKLFNQEVLRVILLDTRYRHISCTLRFMNVAKGSVRVAVCRASKVLPRERKRNRLGIGRC